MARRKRRRIVRKPKMAVDKKIGKMEWELFILVIITLIVVGAFALF